MMYVKLVISNCANDVAFGLTRCEIVPFGVKVSLFSVTTKLLSHAVIETLSGDDINLPRKKTFTGLYTKWDSLTLLK